MGWRLPRPRHPRVRRVADLRLGLAAESAQDARTISDLADRVLCHAVDWLEAEHLPHIRRWMGPNNTPFLDLHAVTRQAKAAFGMRAYGHFKNAPGAPDATLFRSVFLTFAHEHHPPSVVVAARDQDRQPERQEGFRQAVEANDWPFRAILAWAHPEIEAWYLVGFVPQTDREHRLLAELRQTLGFDVHRAPERLAAQGRRDPKPILAELTDGDLERKTACLADLDHLETHGSGCGVSQFCQAVRAQIAPLLAR